MKIRPSSALALALGVSSLVGCGGGGSKKNNFASTAGATSGTTSTATTTSGTTAGTTTAGVTSAQPVNAKVSLGRFVAFRESCSVSDFQVARDVVNKNKAFALEDSGFVRVLDLAGNAPTLERLIALDTTAFPTGCAGGALWLSADGRLATATASGAGKEMVFLFDPSVAKTAADCLKLDFAAVTITFGQNTLNSAGKPIAGPVKPSYTASAVVAGGKLFVATSNLDAQLNYNPGTVLAYDFDPVKKTLANGRLIGTTGFNPNRLTVWRGANGQEAVLVTVGGPSGKGGAAIDVIDPLTAKLVGSIPLSGNVSGPVAITPDGLRGFVGSTSASQVQGLDLSALDQVLANAQPLAYAARATGAIVLPGTAGLNFIAGLAISTSGNYLYASNFNTSAVSVVDISTPQAQVVGLAQGFQRSGDPAKFEGCASALAVRTGTPGIDFQGPAVLVTTISLAKADRVIADVSVALDGIELDKN